MNKSLTPFIGPEALWLLYYVCVLGIARITSSPVKTMDGFWLSLAYVVPFLLVPLSFGLFYVSASTKGWLILRLWIAGLVGGHMVLNQSLLAHSEQGPGVGTAYIMGLILVFIVLIVCSIWAAIRF